MKKFIILIATLLAFNYAYPKGIECDIAFYDRGIRYTECPRGTFATGVDSRILGGGSPGFPYRIQNRVRCIEPYVYCDEKDEEKVDKE